MNRLTQKHEIFCRNWFEGKTKEEAAIIAGYKTKWVRSIASRLSTNTNILARYQELQRKADDESVSTVLERKQILTQIERARLTDYITCGPDRDLINVGSESPNTAAIQEITSRTEYDKDGAGVAVVTKIKLHNPIQAIAEHNKMDNIYQQPPTQGDVVQTFIFVLPDGTKVLPKQLRGEDAAKQEEG